MDKLSAYFKEHRDAFDEQLPPGNAWAGVEARLPVPLDTPKHLASIKLLVKWALAAAAAVLIFGLGAYWGQQNNANVTGGHNVLAQAVQLDPEVQEAEAFFNRKISYATQVLSKSGKGTKVLEDIKKLDAEYLMLTLELNETKERDLVLKAMTENLRTRANMLELVLETLREKDPNIEKIQI